MSGPKSGSVTVRSAERLAAQRRERQRAEAAELQALEKAQRDQKLLGDREMTRLEKLRAKKLRDEQRQQQKEAERVRKRAETEALERARELAAYQSAADAFAANQAEFDLLASRFPGIQVPMAPDVVRPTADTAEALRTATNAVLAQMRARQVMLDAAVAAWNRDKAIRESGSRTRDFVSSFRARATRSASDIIAALDPDSPWVAGAVADTRLQRLIQAGRGLVEDALARDAVEMSANSVAALDKVLEAESDAQAQLELRLLAQSLESDVQTMAARRTEEAALLAAQEARAREESERMERETVALELHDILEDLGYSVSEIASTAFVRNGVLYAAHPSQPQHATRLQLGGNENLRIELVRVKDSAARGNSLDAAANQQSDAAADRQWCGAGGGLSKFLSTARSRGVSISVRGVHEAGTTKLEQVSADELGLPLDNDQDAVRRNDKMRELPRAD
jgi:hypothetical protein